MQIRLRGFSAASFVRSFLLSTNLHKHYSKCNLKKGYYATMEIKRFHLHRNGIEPKVQSCNKLDIQKEEETIGNWLISCLILLAVAAAAIIDNIKVALLAAT